ncbi:MAG: hypothetical protein ACRDQB_16265, partial [Thermocrispum sp.]
MRMRRRGIFRTAVSVAAVPTALVTVLTGCSGSDESPDSRENTSSASAEEAPDDGSGDREASEGDNQPLAEVKGGDNITLMVKAAVREKGGFVSVTGTVTNGGSETWVAPGWQGDEAELANNQASMAGARLVDKEGRKRYFILRDTEGRCLCTKF